MLPKYLQFKTNAAPDAEQTVISGKCRFTVVTSRMIRIEQDEQCRFTDDATLSVICRSFDKPTYSVEQDGTTLTITTEYLKLTYTIGAPLSAESLRIDLTTAPYTVWHYGQKALHNLGGTVSTLDNIKGACEIDDGVCSLDGFATIDDSTTAIMLKDGWFKKRPDGMTDIYFFGYGHDYTASVQDYYRLTGIPEMLPAYALGNWWSRYHKYTDTEYLGLMDKFNEKDVPFSVGIVDMDWHLTDGDGREYNDGWTGYTWNKELFPDYKAFLKGLHDRNLKTALNLHPANGIRYWEEMYPEMCEAMGVDPASKKQIGFDCLNPEFLDKYFEILHFPYEKDGVDFWWMDWQQGLDYGWIHYLQDDKSYRNELECITPLWMLNHMHYLASRRNGGRGMIFSRFSGYGSQRYPIGFSGDTVIDWDSLQFQPYFTATASNIGYGWWSHDIGGHMCGIRDDEMNTRWIQFGVFSPIFRLHSTSNEFLGREPWNYNKRAELTISDFMRLRHQLFPYLYTMSYRDHAELLPLMRPMYHTNPENKEAYEVPNQYWFGSELIAAPITQKSDAVTDMGSATVWLPEGKWVDWFNGYVYNGDVEMKSHERTLKVFRPLEQMPLFCKAGAIVPMQSHVPHDNRLGGSDDFEVVVAAGADNSFTLYEDDGVSLGYQDGNCCKTEYTLDWSDNKAVFTVHPAKGVLSLIPSERKYTVRFIGFAKGCKFAVNGKKVEAEYCAETNTYIVSLGKVDVSVGISVEITADTQLMADNSDCYDRCMDRIMRAQCSVDHKEYYKQKVECALKWCQRDRVHFERSNDDELGKALFEFVSQSPLKKKD